MDSSNAGNKKPLNSIELKLASTELDDGSSIQTTEDALVRESTNISKSAVKMKPSPSRK